MKSILIIANFSSIHIYNFVRNTLDIKSFHIYGLSMSPISSIPSEYNDFYKNYGITITEEDTLPEDSNSTKIWKIKNQLKKLGSFDILHIHYVKHIYTPGIFLLRKNYRRIILTFWGSDFYRSTFLSMACIEPLLWKSDRITFITSKMKDDFIKKNILHRRLDNQCSVLDYGNMLFPYIDAAKENLGNDVLGSYSTFGLSCQKITVTIGYVGRPQMQQKEAVEALVSKLTISSIEKIQIVIPAYGMKNDTIQYLERLLSVKSINYCIISDFLGPNKVALLRSITDVFIHSQTTDAFSSSMQECFYANAIIVNGVWLQYNDIEKVGAYFLKFKDFDSLPEVLSEVIGNIESYKQKSLINKQIMLKMCSWDRWCQEWRSLYL